MIRNGQPAIGSWISLTDAFAVEAMGEEGFDWLLIDIEHSPIGREGLRDILVALRGNKSVPIVRVTSNSSDHFKMALDLGAQGIIVPMIESQEEVARAVGYCRYPPLGQRGIGPVRASNYYHRLEEYLREANEEILLAAQIETMKAVQDLEMILTVKGLDAIFIGPSDLAGSMRFPGQTNHPHVERVIDQIIETARPAGVPYGLPTWSPEEFAKFASRGATLLTIGGDLKFLMDGANDALRRTRSLVRVPAANSPLLKPSSGP